MKKSLLALAVLAASGAAFAQSSVTLYGRVDLGITKITGQSAVMADGSSVGTSSRIGFRGVEDLGGGLKAGFLVETQFDADASKNGGAGSTIGSRNSYIDLMGGFGGVRLGRHLNPALLFAATYGGPWGTDYGYANNANILSIEGARYNNAISYMGKFGDVSVMFTTAMKEGNTYAVANGISTGAAADAATVGAPTGAVGAAKMPLALAVNYGAGPIAAGVTLTKNGRGGDKLLTHVGFTYDAKVVKASLAFEQDGNQVGGKNAYSLGVSAPLGAASVNFVYGKDQKGSAADVTQIAVGGQYNLSKRTNVYGLVGQLKSAGATASNQVTLGVQHQF